jgi:hypothetical protein
MSEEKYFFFSLDVITSSSSNLEIIEVTLLVLLLFLNCMYLRLFVVVVYMNSRDIDVSKPIPSIIHYNLNKDTPNLKLFLNPTLVHDQFHTFIQI